MKLSIRSRAPAASSLLVRKVMRATPSVNTRPEQKLRSALHRSGLRFYKDRRPVPGLRCKVDVVFPKRRVCVFIDGCFWHGCPIHFKVPKVNSEWWKEKVKDNIDRDRRKTVQLQAKGWSVLRVWEHDLNSEENLTHVIGEIKEMLAIEF